jgi:hypothetical protein
MPIAIAKAAWHRRDNTPTCPFENPATAALKKVLKQKGESDGEANLFNT